MQPGFKKLLRKRLRSVIRENVAGCHTNAHHFSARVNSQNRPSLNVNIGCRIAQQSTEFCSARLAILGSLSDQMIQFELESAPVLRTNRRLKVALCIEHQCLPRRIKVPRARAHIHRSHAPSENRAHHRAWNNILLGLEKRLHHSMHWSAASFSSGNLWDYIACKLEARMPCIELHQGLRHLLRRGDADIRDHTAM